MDFLKPLRKYSGILIIIFPIVLMLIGLSSPGPRSSNTVPTPMPVTPTLAAKLLPTGPTGTPEAKINLAGPLNCSYKDAQRSTVVYVQNQSIYASNVKQGGITNLLVKDDCLYVWLPGMKTGEKACGISMYKSFISNYTPTELLNLMGSVNIAGPTSRLTAKATASPSALITPAHSCITTGVPVDKLQLPLGIKFVEKSISDLGL